MLVGHTYAPGGKAVTRLKPRLRLGEVLDKELIVQGARVRDDEDVGPTAAFKKMPLRYERSSGGPGIANPVGVPKEGKPDADGGAFLPNIEASDSAAIDPLGYGPVAAAWPSRRDLLGKHAEEWSHTDWYSESIGGDVKFSYFNCAPADQQLDEVRAGAELVLENLQPGRDASQDGAAGDAPVGVHRTSQRRARAVDDALRHAVDRHRHTTVHDDMAWNSCASTVHERKVVVWWC